MEVERRAAILALALVEFGCSAPVFQCIDDAQCTDAGIRGWCEPAGYCSFADENCDSGRRYGAHGATAVANLCVDIESTGGAPGTESGGTAAGEDDLGEGTSASGTGGSATSDDPGLPPLTTSSTTATDSGPYTGGGVADEAGGSVGSGGTEPTTTTGESTGSGAIPGIEVCDGVDNDGDGLIDEVSPANAVCDQCQLWQQGGRAYAVCPATETWFDARSYCRERGSDLTTIGSGEEQQRVLGFVNMSFAGDHWIGANDLAREGNFQWSNGAPFSYENFGDGEPSNSSGNEHCVEIRQGGPWNDDNCSEQNSFVCESPHDPPE